MCEYMLKNYNVDKNTIVKHVKILHFVKTIGGYVMFLQYTGCTLHYDY